MKKSFGTIRGLLAAAAILSLSTGLASAQADSFIDRLEFSPSVAYLEFSIDVESVEISGVEIPDADLDVSSSTLPAVAIAYKIDENWSIGTLIAPPPEATITGAGLLEGLDIGKVRYLPINAVAQYQFRDFGAFQPFVGAGFAYFLVLDTEDDETSDLEVDNAWGSVLRAGFDIAVDDNMKLHFAYSKVFLETEARTNLPFLFDLQTDVDLRLDPYVIEAGLTFQF